MLKMKKILGILLAVCFVLSVTVASVSAAPQKNEKQWGYDRNNCVGDRINGILRRRDMTTTREKLGQREKELG